MALAAAQIIDAVAALVRTATIGLATPYASSTHTDRGHPFDEDELPAWRVLADDEEIEALTMHYPFIERHTLAVLLEGRVRAVTSLDDAMNDAAATVLAALFASASTASLAGLAKVMRVASISRRLEAEGQAAIGAIDIRLEVVFTTACNAPSTII